MRKLLKKSLWLALVVGVSLDCGAFSLLGPRKGVETTYPDPWQGLNYPSATWPLGLGYNLPGDIGGPMGHDEEYRWNVKHVFYAYDQSFLNYFGHRGVLAVSNAIHLLNRVTNASQLNLQSYPQRGMLSFNYRAQTLGLLDLQSCAFEMLVEQLGLADPVRFTWNLRALDPPVGSPQYFIVINLNHDPQTWSPSWFVNGDMYGYRIVFPPGYAEAQEYLLTPLPGGSYPVASAPILSPYRQQSMRGRQGAGLYWVNLTRDDVGGLRYMLRTNNYNVENFPPGTEIALTNYTAPVLFTNQDLSLLLERTQGTTNDAAGVRSYYPDLNITGSNYYWRLDTRGSLLYYFTNAPFANRTQELGIVRTTNFVPFYNYTFDNVVTNPSPLLTNLWTNLISNPLSSNLFYVLASNILDYVPVTLTNPVNTNNVSVEYLLTNVVVVTNRVFELDPTNALDPAAYTNLYFVDTNNQIPITTSNLALFIQQCLTNSATNLLTIYPDLLITSTYSVLTNQIQTNYIVYPTNPPFAPAGTVVPVFVPEVTNIIVTNYYHTFANIVTNTLYTNSPVSAEKFEVYRPFGAPAGSPIVATNIRSVPYYSNIVNGDFYIVPTNLVGYHLIASLATNDVAVSNSLAPFFLGTNQFGTNLPAGTNILTTNALVYTNHYVLYHGTNYLFSAYPVFAPVSYYTQVVQSAYPIAFAGLTNQGTNAGFLRPGVDKVQFHQTWYDSLLGQAYLVTSTNYWDMYVTNSRPTNVFIRRVISQPDILFVSEDLGWQPWTNGLIPILTDRSGTTAWINNDGMNGNSIQGGPGVIVPAPPIRLAFTDQLPYMLNRSPFWLDEVTATPGILWGSYDGSTNTPIVYPDIISITDIEWLVLHPPPPTYP